MELATLLSVFAVALAAVSILYTRVSARAAKESAAAAQEVTAYQRAEVERNRVRFELRPAKKYVYLLTNSGTESAYGVTIDPAEFHLNGTSTEFSEFPSGHSAEYAIIAAWGIESTHILVKWHHRPDCSDATQQQALYVEKLRRNT